MECPEPALTVAAALSCARSIFLTRVPRQPGQRQQGKDGGVGGAGRGTGGGRKGALELQRTLVEYGFGGPGWRGGSVKGDLIGAIAAYDAWASPRGGGKRDEREQRAFAARHALDHAALGEMRGLREQFREAMIDAGFLERDNGDGRGKDDDEGDESNSGGINASDYKHDDANPNDDALLTSCCLVAGLYPNIAALMRPKRGRGNVRGGRLLTKDGDVCRPSSSSFQADRVRDAHENGGDAYAVFHGKHRTIGAENNKAAGANGKPGTPSPIKNQQQKEVFLSEVNFVSRFALLLFGGELEVRDTALIVDDWLKFKVGERGGGTSGAVLIRELRKELDTVMLRHIMTSGGNGGSSVGLGGDCRRVIGVVRSLLADE